MAYSILKSPSVFLSIEEQRRLKGKDGGKIDSLLIEHIQEKQRRELNMIESCKETAKTKNQSIGARTLNRDAPAISDKYLGGGGDDGDGNNERANSEESDLLINASIRIEQAFMYETRYSIDLLTNDLGGTNNTKTKELLEMTQSYRFSEVHDQSVDQRQSMFDNRQSII